MSEWQKDLSAVAFEAADLVQRVRTLVLAAGALAELVPDDELGRTVHNARFELAAAVALIEAGAEHLLQMDDEHTLDQLADVTEIVVGRCGDQLPAVSEIGAGVHCCLPAGHDGWHRGDDGAEWSFGRPRFSQPGAVLNERGGECGTCGGPLIYDRALSPELLCLKCRRQVSSGAPASADGGTQ